MQSASPTSNRESKREPDEFSQCSLPLLGRLDGPSVAAAEVVATAKTYRDACRLCWQLRRVKGMTKRTAAEVAGLYVSHVSEYLSDDDSKREMPAKYIPAFESLVGNTVISQWIASQARLTVLEEMQARRAA